MTKGTSAILIFDIGKTNKKLLVFNEQYQLLEEYTVQLPETTDEDSYPCEDVFALTRWLRSSLNQILSRKDIIIKAINFSGYGASFVCVDDALQPVMHLCNYLKPFPAEMLNEFYSENGGVNDFSISCASPSFGNLNSGLQLFRIRREKPEVFKKIKWALHLPQYLSCVITGEAFSEMTSIGCHTGLWNFAAGSYHPWVVKEGIDKILPPIEKSNKVIGVRLGNQNIPVGIGLHDSSAALIPYLARFKEPFILVSTGTWNISLNPSNGDPLTADELNQDCLCYLDFTGRPVKASRLFAGHEHDQEVRVLAEKFNVRPDYFQDLKTDDTGHFDFHELPAIAYLEFMKKLVLKQEKAIRLVNKAEDVSQIFVDGGFGRNDIFIKLLAQRFSGSKVFVATVQQASALGAAVAIHTCWNSNELPANLVDLKQIKI